MLKPLDLSDSASWKQRYRAPVVVATQLSKNNRARGLAASNRSGLFQIYAWDTTTDDLRQLTDIPWGKAGAALSPDGRYVYYLADESGNERGHYVRIPWAGGEPEDITPDLPPYNSFSLSFSRAGNRLGMALADADGFHVYAAELEANGELGARQLIFESFSFTSGPFFSSDGALAVVSTTARTGSLHYSLLVFDLTSRSPSGEQIGELFEGVENSVEAALFSPVAGDARLLAVSTKTGYRRPFLWNVQAGERTELNVGALAGEVYPTDWSEDGRTVLLRQFDQAEQRLYRYDLRDHILTPLDAPAGTYGGVYFGPGNEIYAEWQNSAQPTRLIALDAQSGAPTRTVLTASDTPAGRTWRTISFPSSDGQMIQAWLSTPDGEGPFPTIFHTHGGPSSVMTEAFSPSSQAWLDHGFAFVSVNYRGSTTFGRDFQEQINGNLGHWELEDMVACRHWLVTQGIADPAQILLTGWSYGGYLTLFGLGKRPELWAGGMAGIAIADWAVMYEDSADTLRGYQRALFGGGPEEKAAAYARSSPITYAENVAAPVLIIQGRNDTRTTPRPVEMYEEKMRALGKPIEVVWFETGHAGSSMDVEQGIRHQEKMMHFAYQVLG
ncbi:MAG: prolyl oligopeptidase family serine peptidase [Caldilineaceae bacterium]